MKFKAGSRRKAIDYEKDLIDYWRKNKIFEKSVEMRPADKSYVFYDGPPFITGVPHHGTLLSSVVKDAVPRYQTMKGKRVERVWGWDCHGLPAEVYTEQKLGIHDKRDIGTKISLEDYIKACRQNMVQTGNEWEDTIARIGRWVDFAGAYKTMDKDYMESVWWAFKQLYEAGKIYEGEKVLLYCTRDATPIAKAEVAMDNSYQEVTDPSVYVKFKLKDDDYSLLAWTTTPWTLPANTAVAVNKDLEYAKIKTKAGQKLIVASDLLPILSADSKEDDDPIVEVGDKFKGSELVGKEYQPLFEHRGQNAHKVWAAPYVTTEEGTGIVHLAPAYGEEDYELAKANNFPIVSLIDDNGFFTEGNWKDQYVWDSEKQIAKDLQERGVVWKIDYIRHSYPHCHRCGTRLMYRAHPSWFMNIDGQRELMVEQNQNIYWFPEHFKEGRFKKNIEQAPDWNLSRDRFWATALPVWNGKGKDGKEHLKVVGSYAELKELSGAELEDYHRPWIDEVTFEIDGVKYERVDKVMDSWFEAGSMPYAQFHYPFENKEKFEANFPGDFIAEYVGQVRAWFYYLHALSVGLFGKNSFKNVIVTGTIAGNDGRKMSKSYGNFTDPTELMDLYSADALRYVYLSSPLLNGEDFSLLDKDVSDTARKLGMVWNMYDFFTLYASVDGWEWDGELKEPEGLDNLLDKWIIDRLNQLVTEVEVNMDKYDLPDAIKGVLPFIDDASNWYVRRSGKRFWKSDNDQDKQLAYKTLHYVLVRLSQVLAPFTPFLAEELYRKLTGGESVHLTDWPSVKKPDKASHKLLEEMAKVRHIVTEGLAQRAAAHIKVRQPLGKVTVYGTPDMSGDFTEIIRNELNVKEVKIVPKSPKIEPPDKPFKEITDERQGTWPTLDMRVELDTQITDELKSEGIMRELVRAVQNARKNAGLQVDDRIQLKIESESKEVTEAAKKFKDTIFAETLTTGELIGEPQHSESVKVEGHEVKISLAKA